MHGCNFCFVSHTMCDMGRPCSQCVQRGYSHLCSEGPSAQTASAYTFSPWPTSPTFSSFPTTPSSLLPPQLGSPHFAMMGATPACSALSPPASSSASSSHVPAPRSTSTTATTASGQPANRKRRRGSPGGRDRDLDGTSYVGAAGAGYEAIDHPVAALLRAVEALTAEVRGLTADNSKLKGELKAMRAQQNAADRLLASVLSSPSSAFGYPPSLINSDVGRADAALACKPRAVKKYRKATRSAEEADQTEAEPSLPPTALMDAVHELPFLRDYPSLAGFAIPDFRHPVLVCMYSYTIFDPIPPSILYVNPAMSELTGYTWQELIGAPLSKVVVMQEKWHRSMAPHLSNKDPLSLSPAYSFNHLLRTKSGRLYRGIDDCSQFFFGQDGSPKHAVLHLSRWEEGQLREGEAIDHWVGVRLEPQIALPHQPDHALGHLDATWSLPHLSSARVVACDDDDQLDQDAFLPRSARAMQPTTMTEEDMAQMLFDTPASTPAATYATFCPPSPP